MASERIAASSIDLRVIWCLLVFHTVNDKKNGGSVKIVIWFIALVCYGSNLGAKRQGDKLGRVGIM
jgi:hypothetical protein